MKEAKMEIGWEDRMLIEYVIMQMFELYWNHNKDIELANLAEDLLDRMIEFDAKWHLEMKKQEKYTRS